MLIGLCGGMCSGKSSIADYLVIQHGFQRLYLKSSTLTEVTSDNSEPSTVKPEYAFDNSDDLLFFVTKRWRDKWVTTNIHNHNILDQFLRRPFFILISVDAPVCLRWDRWKARQQQNSEKGLTLEEFLAKSDQHLYGSGSDSGQSLISRATVRLLNTSSSLAQLYATLGKLDLKNEDRLRPNWDQYFMQLASLAAQRSNCMKRRVGCVLVREKRVISTGYNGTPRGLKNCGDGGCPRCNEGQHSGIGLGTCLCIHAEENALLEAGRERIREGSILYCDTCPCLTCSIKITQVGISEVVYSQSYSMDEETADVFKEAGIKFRRFVPPPGGTIRLEELSCVQTLHRV
ncbi:Deoxycytidylate deaminase [Erysiphe neolycopersici]|uniref:Deoxycytidylate deaminase n=1 Tax=Erysiphe neolycopersici TaxID=212602 RepID=A0A420HRW3_9PEZI|nr:Deoxycytidylate deaminase [Erysiphe neolycopersici]